MLSRRNFLGALAGLAAKMVLDPECALWVPGAKTISIPAPIRKFRGTWVPALAAYSKDQYMADLLARAKAQKHQAWSEWS